MKNKKLFAILTLVCFLFTLMPVAAMAESDEPVEATAVADGSDTVVAMVGSTTYSALEFQEAIKAAAPSGTVEIVNDVTVAEWNLIAESLSISNGDIITCVLDGLTINGNDHTLTVNSIESAGNGGYLFFDATKLNINNLTIKYADGLVGGIGLKAGIINNVTFDGGVYGVMPQTGAVTIQDSTFKTNGTAIYFEEERDGLTVTGNTFNQPEGVNVILLRGDVKFTNNTINTGRTVNVVSGSPTVTGNTFADGVRLKVYNDAEATIENNTITVLAFNDESEVESTFANNILSADAKAVLLAAGCAFTVTYTDGVEDAVIFDDVVYTVESGSATPAFDGTPTRSGYTFAGWEPEVAATVTDNATYTATWAAIPTYTVTFDSNEGSAVEPQTVEKDAKATKPADPTRTNYTFNGWYSNAELTAEYDFNTPVTGSITLYAKWTYNAPVYVPDYSGTTSTPSTSTPKVETETTVTPSGTKVETTTETKADGTKVETTTTTTASGETTKVETTTETNKEGTKVETTVTTDSKGETSTTVTATLDNGSAVTNNDKAVEVEVTKVEEKVVTQVEEAVKADDNIEVVGTADNAVSVSATDSNTGAAQTNFVQPMAVSVPVDTTVLNNVEDTSKLTLAKVVTNEDGTTDLIYVGGSYDKETGTFNAKVNEDGNYILVEKADLVKIELTIDDTAVKHNDAHHELDVAPVINAETGRTELPLSYLGDALGFEVLWDGETRTVTVVKGDISFSLTIGEEITGYGTPYIDVNSDRTMVSASYISGMLGANVIWDPVDRQVIVVK